MERIYYTVSETAALLGESAVTVRFWCNSFGKLLDPKRNAKGNRLFVQKDIDVLKKIKYLTRDCGLSLEATRRRLDTEGKSGNKNLALRDALLAIREELLSIRADL